jgi:hypothetical protein
LCHHSNDDLLTSKSLNDSKLLILTPTAGVGPILQLLAYLHYFGVDSIEKDGTQGLPNGEQYKELLIATVFKRQWRSNSNRINNKVGKTSRSRREHELVPETVSMYVRAVIIIFLKPKQTGF